MTGIFSVAVFSSGIYSETDISLEFATPISSHTLRVYFHEEPAHISPLAEGDAYRHLAWDFAVVSGPDSARVPYAMDVEDVAYDDVLSLWYAVIAVDTPLLASAVYAISSDAFGGTVEFPGIAPPVKRGIRRAAKYSGVQRNV